MYSFIIDEQIDCRKVGSKKARNRSKSGKRRIERKEGVDCKSDRLANGFHRCALKISEMFDTL